MRRVRLLLSAASAALSPVVLAAVVVLTAAPALARDDGGRSGDAPGEHGLLLATGAGRFVLVDPARPGIRADLPGYADGAQPAALGGAWSPDGRLLLLQLASGDDGYVVTDLLGRSRRAVDPWPGQTQWMDWSRDGRSLWALRAAGSGRELWRVPLDGGAPTLVVRAEAFQPEGTVTFPPREQPDGSGLLIGRYVVAEGRAELLRLDLGSGQLGPAPVSLGFTWLPVWSPDGSRAVVPRDGGLFLTGPHGEGGVPIGTGGVRVESLAWSPDGRFIAYVWAAGGVTGTRLHDTATGRTLPLPLAAAHLSWQPAVPCPGGVWDGGAQRCLSAADRDGETGRQGS